MGSQEQLREHVMYLLNGGGAHMSLTDALEGLPRELRGVKPEGVPYTPWRLLEHIRIAQKDILEFSRDPHWQSPPWPEGYWPEGLAPAEGEDWDFSVEAFEADRRALIDLVADPENDLLEAFPHGQGQTLLREALLAADHNSYHIGQLVTVRRLLGAMETDSRPPDNV